MKNKKLLLASLIVVLVASTLVGCGPKKDKDMVTMVTDMGGVDDKSFNQSAWEGLEEFREKYDKIEVKFIESNSEDEYSPNLQAAVDEGSDLTWAVGYMMASQLQEVAEANPDTSFAIIDWAPEDEDEALENVSYVMFKQNEGSFLVGLIAGLTTKSNKVGFVGGMSGGLIKEFEVGYRAGVKTANPDAEVYFDYAEDWGNLEKGEQIATTMIKKGADVIYHAAGGTGIGVANACDKNEVWFIGVDRDQSDLTPHTLTSMLKRVDQAVLTISSEWAEDNFEGKKIQHLGLKEGGVGYVYDEEKIDADVKAKVDEYEEKIKKGELVVPNTEDELTEYLDSLK